MDWWKSLFCKRPLDSQLDSELRFLIEELTQANMAAGLEPEEARRQAMVAFGGKEQIKEEVRDVYRLRLAERALGNLRSAVRFMRKSPMFSIAVVATLARGLAPTARYLQPLTPSSSGPCHFPKAVNW